MDIKDWTIMVYMAGDNNLAVDMAYAMEQIKEVAQKGAGDRNVLVYYDGNSPQIPTLYCDFSQPNPEYIPSVTAEDKLYSVPHKWNENAADTKSVMNFINWCVNTRGRRAKRYGLIFSGHSLGFMDKGLFRDETSGKSMKIEDMFFMLQRSVLPEASLQEMAHEKGYEGEDFKRETTVLLGQQLDLLGFDSCVMGMLEVGYQFQDLTKTMIVSEGSVPSAGWSYAKILGNLCGGKWSTKWVAETFVKEFIHGQDNFVVGGVNVDMAAWDLQDGLNDLANALDGLSQALIDCFQDPKTTIYKQMERVILSVHWKCQSYMLDQNIDLADFCELLQAECKSLSEELGGADDLAILKDLQDCCARVIELVRRAVLQSGFSGGEGQYSNGISIYFPWTWEGYLVSKTNYESLWFTKDRKNKNYGEKWEGWSDFLKLYLSKVSLRPVAPLTPDAPVGSLYRYQPKGISFDNLPIPDNGQEGESKLGHSQTSKMGNSQTSKMGNSQTSKMGNSQTSKMGNSQTSKMGNSQTSKMGNSQTSKMGNSQTSKMGNSQTSKMGNSQTSKMGVGGGDHFFDKLGLWKNIETRFDISGFTKRPDDVVKESPYQTPEEEQK